MSARRAREVAAETSSMWRLFSGGTYLHSARFRRNCRENAIKRAPCWVVRPRSRARRRENAR